MLSLQRGSFAYADISSRERSTQLWKTSEETKTACHGVEQNFHTLIAMLQSMPRDLGYTWEGGELKQHVTLIQASGEQQTVPIDFCASYEVGHTRHLHGTFSH